MQPNPIRAPFAALLLALAAGCAPTDDAVSEVPEGAVDSPADAGFQFTGDFDGPLGLQLYSLRNEFPSDVPGTLAKVRQMGFRTVETAGTYGMTPAQFRQELDRAGLDAVAGHAPYERFRDSTTAVLDEAEALGLDYIGVAWIPHPEGQPFTVQMAREAAANFNRWGQAARERGLRFFYHVHGYEFQPTADGTVPFDVMVAETRPEDVAYEMDVFWVAHPGVDPAALLRKYPNRWELMHIKDMRQGVQTPDYSGHAPPEAQVPVGTGQINYRAVLQAAEEIGVKHYFVEDETTDPLGNIPQSTRFLEGVTY
jgi:sugar phosphate isomerase/epimerase